MYVRLLKLWLVMVLVSLPLVAFATVYHYTHFEQGSADYGKAILLKSEPGVFHTVTLASLFVCLLLVSAVKVSAQQIASET